MVRKEAAKHKRTRLNPHTDVERIEVWGLKLAFIHSVGYSASGTVGHLPGILEMLRALQKPPFSVTEIFTVLADWI